MKLLHRKSGVEKSSLTQRMVFASAAALRV